MDVQLDVVGPALFVATLLWDIGRRFASRGQTVNLDEFSEVADTVEGHEAAMADLAQLKEHLVLVKDLHAKVATHEKALETHAETIVAHGKELAGQARTLTAVGLSRAIPGRAKRGDVP